MDTLPALLDELLGTDATRPLITYYDDATGERIELSVKSFDNAVAKTANLVQDELGLDSGEACCVLLPTHWQGAVWVFAAAACGLRLVEHPGAADVVVCGPEEIEHAATAGAPHVVAMALRPLGGAFTEALPAGVVDHGAEAPGQPDVFVAAVPVTGDAELFDGASQQDVLARAVEAADLSELGRGGRVLTDRSPADPEGLVTGLLAALTTGGSLVLVRNADPAGIARRVEQEQVTAVV